MSVFFRKLKILGSRVFSQSNRLVRRISINRQETFRGKVFPKKVRNPSALGLRLSASSIRRHKKPSKEPIASTILDCMWSIGIPLRYFGFELSRAIATSLSAAKKVLGEVKSI